jgi:hypothetical protein
MGKLLAKHLDDITAWLDAQNTWTSSTSTIHVMQQPLTSAETVNGFWGITWIAQDGRCG